MTLTNRLTLYFLTSLGVVLGSGSTATYLLARTYLKRQLNERASATLDTLMAASEIEPEGLDWEPKDRRILLRNGGESPEWAVYDEAGGRLDGAGNPFRALDTCAVVGPDMKQSRMEIEFAGESWLLVGRTLRHPTPEAVRSTDGQKRHQALVFVTAYPLAPVHRALGMLAACLGGVSLALWVVAGLSGRWVCRRALAPVRRMAESATRITGNDLAERLPVPPARDELHDLAERFNDLLARLQESFARQKRFTGEASHQLRTPLTAMLGQMEVALRRDREPDDYRRVLGSAVAQAGRMGQIVESLLFLARADAEVELPGLETIDLAEWLRSYVVEHPAAEPGRVRLAVPLPTGVRFNAHRAMLGQALGNLIDNACKYSASGSAVTLHAGLDRGEAVLTVEDSGCGIDPADLARVCEPFFRSAEARRRGVVGYGLGLAVASRIVRAFGGRIVMDSEPGRGSRFGIRLPLQSSAAS